MKKSFDMGIIIAIALSGHARNNSYVHQVIHQGENRAGVGKEKETFKKNEFQSSKNSSASKSRSEIQAREVGGASPGAAGFVWAYAGANKNLDENWFSLKRQNHPTGFVWITEKLVQTEAVSKGEVPRRLLSMVITKRHKRRHVETPVSAKEKGAPGLLTPGLLA